MKSSRNLDKILNAEIPPHIKAAIGYEGEANKSKAKDNKNIIFVKAIKDNEGEKMESTRLESNRTMIYNQTRKTSSNLK